MPKAIQQFEARVQIIHNIKISLPLKPALNAIRLNFAPPHCA